MTSTSLADYTTPELLIPSLYSRTAAGAILELCAGFQSEGRVPDVMAFYQTVLSRETLCSTAVSPGWAVPHARMRGLPRISFGVGLSAEPINWFGNAAQPVRIVFLFAVPEDEAASYLRLISGLAQLSRDAVVLAHLLSSTDSHSMLKVLQDIPVRRAGRGKSQLEPNRCN